MSAVADPVDRVRASMGPLPGREAEYWETLAAWRDWSAWTPASRVEGYGELANQPAWGTRVRAMAAELAADAALEAVQP